MVVGGYHIKNVKRRILYVYRRGNFDYKKKEKNEIMLYTYKNKEIKSEIKMSGVGGGGETKIARFFRVSSLYDGSSQSRARIRSAAAARPEICPDAGTLAACQHTATSSA